MKTTMRNTLLILFFVCLSSLSLKLFGQSNELVRDSIHQQTEPRQEIISHPEIFLSPLDDKVNESSGLIFWQGKIWTHNDSGGEPDLYAIDTATGKIIQTITLVNGQNTDWEDITQDEANIYVGDVGNNRGNRKNLRIYKIPKNQIPSTGNAALADFETIYFSYSDQESFEKKFNGHNFDCEAITTLGDSIFLFTKNWADQRTKVYALPKAAGVYELAPVKSFDAGGLITGSAISPANDQLVLLGYVDFESFMWLFWDFDGSDFFGGNKLRVNFPEMIFVQTEGICFAGDNQVLISCEESSEFPTLFSVSADALKLESVMPLGNSYSTKIILSGMPPHASNRLRVDVLELPYPEFSFELRNRKWVKLFEGNGVMGEDRNKMRISIKTKDIENGLYFLKVISGNHSIIRKVRIKH